jgi:TRAP-type mannitol/chloroaromatic compound transport system permease small subunit
LRVLIKYVQIVDAISERLGWLSMLFVVMAVVVSFFNVIVRYLGRYIGVQLSSNLLIELQWHLYSLVFFLGFAYILKHGINVRVDFIYAKWPRKRKAMVDFWGHLFFLVPFCIMGIYVTINPVLTAWGRRPNGSWGTWELSPDPSGLPRAPIKTMIIVAFVLLLLQAIAELIKLGAVLREREFVTVEELETEEPLRIE